MKKLKIILNCNYFYIFLFILLSIYLGIRVVIREDKSIYDINDTKFNLIIEDYKFDGNKLTLELKGKENLIGTYYVESYQELLDLKEKIKYGSNVEVYGTLSIPSNNTIPSSFNYKKYLSDNDIYYTLSIDKIGFLDTKINIIYRLKNIIQDRIDCIDSTGYMEAFILGSKDNIDKEVYGSYQKIGITHLFALSGMHVGLLSGIIIKLLKNINETKRYIIIDFILVIYGFIVGFPSSIKRCILFFILNSINKIFKLEISSFKLLLLVIFCLIIYNYKIIYDVGFIYSICTVGGIILCNEFISHDNKLVSSFRLSLVAFLFSLPISLSNFYEINVLSIIYNMVFVPFVSIIVYPLSLLSFILPCIYDLFLLFIKVLEVSSSYLSNIKIFNLYLDFNMLEIISFYFITIFMFYKSKYGLSILLCLIVILDIVIPYLDSNGYVYFFDVGQGDSSLVISPYRSDVILIDTGGVVSYGLDEWSKKDNYYVSDNVISFIKSIGIKSIDLLILSHGDTDHANEVNNIIKDIDIKCLNINLGDINSLESNSKELIDTCLYEPKNMVLKYLNYDIYDNENDNSLLSYMKIYDTSILSLGDASSEVEENLVSKYKFNDLDILKVSHHGSKSSSSKEFIDSINPKYSIISVGKNNRYGHPNDSVLNNLKNSKVYRTDEQGSIMFEISKGKLNIETFGP